jgi:hypothetical protein
MWMLEFHRYRSTVAHGESLSGRTWGWTPLEHLVMAAFVFPLVVKLHLVQEGHYSLSPEDEAHCRAVDALLSQAHWATGSSSMRSKWQSMIRAQKQEVRLTAAVEKALADLKAKGVIKPCETTSETRQPSDLRASRR